MLASLQNENIVRVYGCGIDKGKCLYLAMEYLDGISLSEILIGGKRLDWRRTARIGIQVCSALSAAHKLGIIHRDVAPKNIMLVSQNEAELVKVLDFGLSTVLPQSDVAVQRLTQSGALVGTLFYMSPEAAMGQKVDERSDVYSLGAVLYECLCAVYGDYQTSSLRVLTGIRLAGNDPVRQMALYEDFSKLLDADKRSDPYVDYYMTITEAHLQYRDGKLAAAAERARHAWQAIQHTDIKVANDVFSAYLELLQIEQLLNNKTGVRRAFDACEQAALRVSFGYRFSANGFAVTHGRGVDLFDTLQRTVQDPQLKARAQAQRRRVAREEGME